MPRRSARRNEANNLNILDVELVGDDARHEVLADPLQFEARRNVDLAHQRTRGVEHAPASRLVGPADVFTQPDVTTRRRPDAPPVRQELGALDLQPEVRVRLEQLRRSIRGTVRELFFLTLSGRRPDLVGQGRGWLE